MKRLWITLGILVLLSPLGMLAPGTAWGEWGLEELEEMGITIPAGLQRFSNLHPFVLIPDYSLPQLGESFWGQAVIYIISGLVGMGMCVVLVYLLVLGKKEQGK
ncbi:MAG: PDGLE domain-containing protein [candidate division WOR-3 bacterium]